MKTRDVKSQKSPRERILATAIELFNSKGIRATGVDTLIEHSDVAKMTFYKYFPTKQALVMEYLKEHDLQILARFHNLLQEKATAPKQRLLGIFDVLKELQGDPAFQGCVFINAIVESRNSDSQEHQFSAEHKKVFWSLLKEVASEAKLKTPATIADELFLLFQGAVVTSQIENSDKAVYTAKEMARSILSKK